MLADQYEEEYGVYEAERGYRNEPRKGEHNMSEDDESARKAEKKARKRSHKKKDKKEKKPKKGKRKHRSEEPEEGACEEQTEPEYGESPS